MRLHATRYKTLLLAAWIVFLVVLGIRSLLTHDSRFGRAMFHQQVNYNLVYTYTDSVDEKELLFTDNMFKGKSHNKLLPNKRHQSRYGLGTVIASTKSVLSEVRDKDLYPSDAKTLHIVLTYRINKHTTTYTEKYSLPVSPHDAKNQ